MKQCSMRMVGEVSQGFFLIPARVKLFGKLNLISITEILRMFYCIKFTFLP